MATATAALTGVNPIKSQSHFRPEHGLALPRSVTGRAWLSAHAHLLVYNSSIPSDSGTAAASLDPLLSCLVSRLDWHGHGHLPNRRFDQRLSLLLHQLSPFPMEKCLQSLSSTRFISRQVGSQSQMKKAIERKIYCSYRDLVSSTNPEHPRAMFRLGFTLSSLRAERKMASYSWRFIPRFASDG